MIPCCFVEKKRLECGFFFVDKCGVPALSGMVPQLSSRISGGRAVTMETTAWHVILRENEKVFL